MIKLIWFQCWHFLSVTCSYFLLILNWVSFYRSAIAVNLKACNHFRLYNGKAAEVRFGSVSLLCPVCLSDPLSSYYISLKHFGLILFLSQAELKTLQETASPSFSFANDLIKHNLVSYMEHFPLSSECLWLVNIHDIHAQYSQSA